MLVPTDVVSFGTITGRTSGMVTTLPNAKASKLAKLGYTVKYQLHHAPVGYTFVGFDFSALELVIAAAINSAEFCQLSKIKYDPFATEAGERIFRGSSADGTDIHTVIAKEVGISRDTSKIFSYSTLYGSGIAGLSNLYRVERPDLSDSEITNTAKSFLNYFKGGRVSGTKFFSGGIFSHQHNYGVRRVSERNPTLPFLGTHITSALTPVAVGDDYMPSRLNWVIQGSAGELHDYCLVKIHNRLPIGGRFYLSIHDDLRFMVKTGDAEYTKELCHSVHAKAWHAFFKSLGFENAPIEVANNVEVDIDNICRKIAGQGFPTHTDNIS